MIDHQPDYCASLTPILLVANDESARHDGGAAIGAAGARMVACVDFAEAVDRIAGAGWVDGVVIEAQGVDDQAVSELLTRVDTLARDRALRTVIALDTGQIDLVTAVMLGSHVTLLCDPDIADRATALAIGRVVASRLHETRRDEAERLRALNNEVARIADTLARLSRSADPPVPKVLDDPDEHDAAEPVHAITVRAVIRARRMRANFFGGQLFADPAWDMLLDLFAAELEYTRVSVSSLCIAAAVPGTTALRWIGTMLDVGLLDRTADPLDRRRAYLSLSPTASDGMRRYFTALKRAGLAIV